MPVFGVAGGGMRDAGWAANPSVAKAGLRGELSTATVLDALCQTPGSATVLHDLLIPIPGVSANIDHILVAGRHVWILDSKLWRPGFYWTLRGRTRVGWRRAPHVDKRTIPMAAGAIAAYLRARGLRAHLDTPAVIVWGSQPGTLSLWAATTPGARLIGGDRFAVLARRRCSRPADPRLVAALAQLVRNPTSAGGWG